MIGIRNRSMVTGNFSGSRIMKLFGNKKSVNNQKNPDVRHEQNYYETREIICPYCGVSNKIQMEFCIGCGSKLEN